jgi:beta-glucuronidase
MKTYPFFEKRKIHDLNDIWDFEFFEKLDIDNMDVSNLKFTDRIPVPSAFDALPKYAGKRGVGVYRKTPKVTPGKKSLLKFGGAGMSCKVFVDGELLVSHIGTYTQFEVIVPASLQEEREIIIIVDNRYDYDNCPLHENFFDFYNYGGIIRQLWLEELPDNFIRKIWIHIKDISSGKIEIELELCNCDVQILYSIDGKAFDQIDADYIERDTLSFEVEVPEPSLWSPENPNLHTVTVDTGFDSVTARFGLRTISTKKGHILINGKPVKLLGCCRHEAHPQFGPSTPDAQIVADLQILKQMGCNFIRGTHYQQDPRLLDLCDEYGFMFFSESLGWGQLENHLADEKFIQAQLDQTWSMILSDFNHPSIIIWGFLNEGGSNLECARKCYLPLIEMIRAMDSSRLVSYASNTWLDDLLLEKIDVISFNLYPGWYSEKRDEPYTFNDVSSTINKALDGLEARGLCDKPFIISEIGAGAIYGWRDIQNGYWTEEYQCEVLKRVCEEVVNNEKISGVALWQFCDCRTFQGPRALYRPRAFNNKGILDEYRRPKAAFEAVKKCFNEYKHQNCACRKDS